MFTAFIVLSSLGAAWAQTPVPFVNQPLVPDAVAPGGPAFTLTVNGTGFVSGATVNWNGTSIATTFVSSTQLTAMVPAANIASPGTASINVLNPGSTVASNVVFLPETVPGATITFSSALGSPVAVGTSPLSVAVGDFNGDGRLDLAVANELSNNLTILMGNGDGTFTLALSSPATGMSPESVVVGDFNGDGKLDLAVANLNSNNVTILLGNGDGTFTPTLLSPATGTGPWTLAAGDFNGDGKLDLVTANSYGDVTVLLGNGDGTFSAPVSSSASGFYLGRIGVGDFNGDGRLDLALANFVGNEVTILLGNGDGTFAPTSTSPATGVEPDALAVGDFNGDGKLDLAVANRCGNSDTCSTSTPSMVTILLGNGDGTFTPSASSPTSPAYDVMTGDFNGDGKLDLAVGIGSGVTILLGNEDGTFTPTLGAGPADLVNSVAVGDFNGDGRLDLATANIAGNNVSVFLQVLGATLFPAPLTFSDQTINTTSAAQAVTLTNESGLPVTISSMSVGGTNAGDFTLAASTTTCSATTPVGPNGGTCTISVTFTPSATGTSTGTLTVTDSAPNSPQTVSLTGTGTAAPAPAVSLSSNSLTFPTQTVNTPSTAQSVTLTNTGNAALTISQIAPSGDFSDTNNCPASLAANANCAINVTFTPTATGTRNGAVTITDNAANSPQTVGLTGTGAGGGTPTVGLSGTSLFFATATAVGSDRPATTTSQTLTIINTGNAQLTFTAIQTSPGDFSVDASGSTCSPSAPLAIGASCTVELLFAPTQAGEQDSALTISDNAPKSPQTVSLKGFGMHGYVQNAPDVPATYDGTQECITADEGCALSSASSVMTTFNPIANAIGLNTYLTNHNGYCTKSTKVECNINWTAVPGYMSTLETPTSIYLLPWCTVSSLNIVQAPGCTKQLLYAYLEDQVVTNQNRVVLGLTYTTTSGSLPGTHWIVVTAPNGPNDWYVFDPAFSKATDPSALTSLNSHLNGFTYISPTTNETATVTFTVTDVGVYALGVMPSYDVVACSPVELLITDPQGRQLGNAGSGSDVFEIPDASYSRGFPLADDTGGGPPVGDPAGTKLIHILSPLAGTYSLAATGTASGTYALTIQSTATDGTIQQTTVTGTTSPGAVAPYQVTYDPAPGNAPTVTALPNAALSANSVNLGSQLVGSTSGAQTVTLMNTGNATLTISGITASGDFSQTNTCGSSLAAGANCPISVTFKPTAGGTRTGSISISDNAAGSPESVAVSGTGQDFTLAASSGSSTSATVAPGSPATYTLSVGGEGGLSGTVSFSCTGAPSEATCTVSPNQVTASSSPTNVTVSVTTTAPSVNAPRSRPLSPVSPLLPALRGLLTLALILAAMAWAIARRNQPCVSRWQSTIVPLASGLLLTLALAGCGGGGGGGGGGTTPNPGTPAGTYTLTVTGSTGSGSSALSHSVTLTLTVN